MSDALEDRQRPQVLGPIRSWPGSVNELDGHAALADGRRHPLHRVEPHVAGGEDPGPLVSNAYGARPGGRAACSDSAGQVGSGGHQAPPVAGHRLTQPLVRGDAPMKNEEASRPAVVPGAGSTIGDGQPLEVAVAAGGHHLGAEAHLDAGRRLDAVDEVRDIAASRPAARTTITTRLAWRARLSAAWPAELAAPTT